MVKPKIANENRKQKFKRIATKRTRRVLEGLRLIGNCANSHVYSYSQDDVNKIFTAIEKEVKRVKSLFNQPVSNFTLD